MTLRKRAKVESGPPKARSFSKESQRAFSRLSTTLISPLPGTKHYEMTSVARGAATPVFYDLALKPTLKVTPKAPPGPPESLQSRKCRKAALARWHPVTYIKDKTDPLGGVIGEARQLLPEATELRHWRRGESKNDHGSYRQASATQMLEIIEQISSKQLKWTELDLLYNTGKTTVSGGSVRAA